MMLSAPLAARAFATTFFMSAGARNWPFLMLTGFPARATAPDEVGLAAKKRRRLQHVDHLCDLADVGLRVDVGQHGNADLAPDLGEDAAAPPRGPDPRYDVPELRFALSYDDLKMNGTPSAAQVSFSAPATSIWSCCDSTTQGPAIRNSGCSSPASKPQSLIARGQLARFSARFARRACQTDANELCHSVGRAFDGRAPLPRECRPDESDEQRMAAPRVRRELGMELTAEEPGMVRELDHLAKVACDLASRPCADRETRRLEPRQVMVVHFVAVPMALRYRRCAVDPVRERPGHHVAGLRAEAHRAAHVGVRAAALDRAVPILPLGDQRDDRMRRVGIELGAVRAVEAR
jgi:hypothetical protein